jgi:hypothetical protein
MFPGYRNQDFELVGVLAPSEGMRLAYTTWKFNIFFVQKRTMIIKEYNESITEYCIKVLLYVRNVNSYMVQPALEHC